MSTSTAVNESSRLAETLQPQARRCGIQFDGLRNKIDANVSVVASLPSKGMCQTCTHTDEHSLNINPSIFRVRTLNAPIPAGILKSISPHATAIRDNFRNVNPDLQSINFYRYFRQISGGIQEYMESLLFQHYLTTQTLLDYDGAAQNLDSMVAAELPKESSGQQQELGDSNTAQQDQCGLLTPSDYLLGIFDFTGELMRLAITTMAVSSNPAKATLGNEDMSPSKPPRTTHTDLQALRAHLAVLNYDYKSDGHFAKEADKKLEVTMASVEKVEKALYGLIIRGSERPKGWMPDLNELGGEGHREAIEGY